MNGNDINITIVMRQCLKLIIIINVKHCLTALVILCQYHTHLLSHIHGSNFKILLRSLHFYLMALTVANCAPLARLHGLSL